MTGKQKKAIKAANPLTSNQGAPELGGKRLLPYLQGIILVARNNVLTMRIMKRMGRERIAPAPKLKVPPASLICTIFSGSSYQSNR